MFEDNNVGAALALLGVIADPEKAKTELRKIAEAHAALTKREEEIARKDRDAAAAERIVQESDKRMAAIRAREADLSDQAARLTAMREAADRDMTARERRCAERDMSLSAREQELERARGELDGQIAAHARTVAEAEKRFSARDAEQGEREARLNHWESRLHVWANDLEALRIKLDKRAA